jgi:5'-3' exonuclease
MPGPLLVVDAPFVLYRSFFALPDSIHGSVGRPINALLGSVNILLRVAADRSPRAIVVCFGAEAAAYRVELYPPYHAARPPVPDDLQWQFEQAPELYESFGWSVLNTDKFEADDLLGSLAQAEAEAGGQTLILTGDRDMYQCVSDRVSVMYLRQGTSGFEEVNPAGVKERYGIGPELVPDFIALRGDPSDGLPGAPGVGPKTAAELLRAHGSLESVIEHASEQRPRIAAALTDTAEALRHFKAIATLQIVELERPADRPTDMQGGAEAAKRFGMNQLAGRLEHAASVADL